MAAAIEYFSRVTARHQQRQRQLAAFAAAAQALRHAQRLAEGFHDYCHASHQLAHRAPEHFEHCDWQASQMDTVERLELFERCVALTVAGLGAVPADATLPAAFWQDVQTRYAQLIDTHADALLGNAFFSRVAQQVRRSLGTDLSTPGERLLDAPLAHSGAGLGLRHYPCRESLLAGFRRLLADLPLDAEWQDMVGSARQAVAAIPQVLLQGPRQEAVETLQLLPVVFYRFTRAYAVGRLISPARRVPMAIAITNTATGAIIDDVLLGEATLARLFTGPGACFQLDPEGSGVSTYLRSLMPSLSCGDVATALGMPAEG